MKISTKFFAAALAITVSLSACATIEEAQNNRAVAAYKSGDYEAAVEIWSKLADSGNARAQNNMGVAYDLGTGVEQNRETAMMWFQKSASQGFTLAKANIGDSYYRGTGVVQDYSEAARWYRPAAIAGDDESQFRMGEMARKGLGVRRDAVRAFVWYSFAAENGYESAAEALEKLSMKLTRDQRLRAEALLADCKSSGLDVC